MRVEHIGDATLRWTCEQCGARFAREKSGARPIRFCGQPCYHLWKRENGADHGRFKPGHVTWNKGAKGLRLSPASEWKKGQRGRNWMPVGAETIRADKGGKLRAFVKIAEPNKWRERAIVVWERDNGPLPSGYVVHHKDRNSLNDAPSNLQALTRAEHIAEHQSELKSAEPAPKPVQEGLAL